MIPKEYRQNLKADYDCDEYKQQLVDEYNASVGNLIGYNCDKCKNKGFIQYYDGQEIINRVCECMKIRESLKNARESGLNDILKSNTFKSFKVESQWQKELKNLAYEYINNTKERNWFFVGGQSGAGKTHICTAICGQLLKARLKVQYMMWVSDIRELKTNVNDGAYNELFDKFAKTDVLYIDDLFKVKNGARPSDSDVQRTYELINYRYNARKRTIISSELTLSEIYDIDEAIGGRIKQMAGQYFTEIGPDINKNWRLK